jgi:hypothetical protein
MAQRSITIKDAELIVMIGTEVEGGYLVREKDYQNIERTLKSFLEHSRRVVGKRLVLASGEIMTAYHASARSERRLLRSAWDSDLD